MISGCTMLVDCKDFKGFKIARHCMMLDDDSPSL